MEEFIQVFTTVEKKIHAERIARELVERRLAACVQIVGPVESRYRWKGHVESAEEWLCIIKSRASLFPDLEKAIKEMHPYEVPEITAAPIIAGSKDYFDWLNDSTSPTQKEL